MDNVEPQVDNSNTQTAPAGVEPVGTIDTGVKETPKAPNTPASWKQGLSDDLKNSPLLQKFEDSIEGLSKAFESHANLEKLLGHEKVPIPKGMDDVEGWNRFSKAMGIPDKAEGYGLPTPDMPKELGEISVDKNKFAEISHSLKLTPAQAKGLWEAYTNEIKNSYEGFQKKQAETLTNTVNKLRSEWGDAYETNVSLGQEVINKFCDSQEQADLITNLLAQSPEGVKFLSKIGNQFAENKIGDFSLKKFSLAPEEAFNEWQKIVRDDNHPYNNEKATSKEREAAIDLVNSLIKASKGYR